MHFPPILLNFLVYRVTRKAGLLSSVDVRLCLPLSCVRKRLKCHCVLMMFVLSGLAWSNLTARACELRARLQKGGRRTFLVGGAGGVGGGRG